MTSIIDIAKRLSKNGTVNVDVLSKIEDIIEKYESYKRDVEIEKDRHDRKNRKLLKQLVEIQSSCVHEVTYYSGDPSGGGDHYNVCEICGKEL